MRIDPNQDYCLSGIPLAQARVLVTRQELHRSERELDLAIARGEEPEEIKALEHVVKKNRLIADRQEELADRIERGEEEEDHGLLD